KMTRRQALKAGTVGVVAIGVSGCGAAAHAGRVVVSVAWPTIQRVVTAIVRRSGNLIVTAIVAAIERTLNATLSSEQASSLGKRRPIVPPDRRWSGTPDSLHDRIIEGGHGRACLHRDHGGQLLDCPPES